MPTAHYSGVSQEVEVGAAWGNGVLNEDAPTWSGQASARRDLAVGLLFALFGSRQRRAHGTKQWGAHWDTLSSVHVFRPPGIPFLLRSNSARERNKAALFASAIYPAGDVPDGVPQYFHSTRPAARPKYRPLRQRRRAALAKYPSPENLGVSFSECRLHPGEVSVAARCHSLVRWQATLFSIY